jgi:hypothetical protein
MGLGTVAGQAGDTLARIVFVHGIGQQDSDRDQQERLWFSGLVTGVLRSGHRHAAELVEELRTDRAATCGMAFYGDLFLPRGLSDDPAVSAVADDIAEDLAQEVLICAATRGEPRCAAEADEALARAGVAPAASEESGLVSSRGGLVADGNRWLADRVFDVTRSVLAALDGNRWLAARIFGVAQRARPDLGQVARYLADGDLRHAVQQRAIDLIDEDTVLVIGHSLGSVVAWEVSQRLSRPLLMLLTLGSPLGIGNVVYPRLSPQPPCWPRGVRRWVNIAHHDDYIAVEPQLAPLFPSSDGRLVEDHPLASSRDGEPVGRHEHHSVSGYLERAETGLAVAQALRHRSDPSRC